LPAGVAAPKKVRIYERSGHFLLQWWDPTHKKTLSLRIDGDLLEAIVRAREIDGRLANYRASGLPVGRIGHDQLVVAYLGDLTKRADAKEIDPRTVERYRTPLEHHYLPFVSQPSVARSYQYASDVDREFQLLFAGFLQSRQVAPNGSAAAAKRPMRGQPFVLDVVRAMFHWAADPARGNLLPEGFRNPLRRTAARRAAATTLSEPDITIEMAVALLSACDAFQLPIFATLALYGLRPDELGWLFWEDIHGGWVRMMCQSELAYETKSCRDKQFPSLDCLQAIWPQSIQEGQGLLFHRRIMSIVTIATKAEIINEFERVRRSASKLSAAHERQMRDAVLDTAGQLEYDHIKQEFHKLAESLGWPDRATLKDFRHLFATSLENAGVPESYRRYLMGHSPGRAAIVTYTHLNKLKAHYMRAVDNELEPLVGAIRRRAVEIGLPQSAS
jgi:integrase